MRFEYNPCHILLKLLIGLSDSYRGPGRPSAVLNLEDVEPLRHMHFTWCQIAEILGVSRSTLYRRIEEEGLSRDLTYTITNAELDLQIEAIKKLHPNDGG